jgi:cytochrome c-type protein NapB
MKKPVAIVTPVVMAALLFAVPATYGAEQLKSLRGNTPIDQEASAPPMKDTQRERAPLERNYVQQPPIIPHSIRGYQVTKNYNKCMDCHSWQAYRTSGATKISLTHFKDRAGTDLSNVSPLRYFCTQCHVPQMEAPPLVENKFSPVEAVKSRK